MHFTKGKVIVSPGRKDFLPQALIQPSDYKDGPDLLFFFLFFFKNKPPTASSVAAPPSSTFTLPSSHGCPCPAGGLLYPGPPVPHYGHPVPPWPPPATASSTPLPLPCRNHPALPRRPSSLLPFDLALPSRRPRQNNGVKGKQGGGVSTAGWWPKIHLVCFYFFAARPDLAVPRLNLVWGRPDPACGG